MRIKILKKAIYRSFLEKAVPASFCTRGDCVVCNNHINKGDLYYLYENINNKDAESFLVHSKCLKEFQKLYNTINCDEN